MSEEREAYEEPEHGAPERFRQAGRVMGRPRDARGIRADSPEELTARITRHLDRLNQDPVVFTWKYRLEDIVLTDSNGTSESII